MTQPTTVVGSIALAAILMAVPIGRGGELAEACAQGRPGCPDPIGTPCPYGCEPAPFEVCKHPDQIIVDEDWTCALPNFGCWEEG